MVTEVNRRASANRLPDWLNELYYIAPMENLESICQMGILCHREAERIPHLSIASEEVQSIRKDKAVPRGKPLHHYANLYLNPRNPMLYRVIQERGKDKICVIGVDPGIALVEGSVITDGNAASEHTRFYPSPSGLANLEPYRKRIFMKYWTAGNPDRESENIRLQCAEVLVPDRVPPDYLRHLYLANEGMAAPVRTLYSQQIGSLNLQVTVKTYYFFG